MKDFQRKVYGEIYKEKYIDELHLIIEKYKNEPSAYMDIVQLYGEITQVYFSMGKYRISIPVVEEFIEFANIRTFMGLLLNLYTSAGLKPS